MLTFDSVKLRLEREQSLSYMEFNYMILQAYDFYQLFKNNNCILQIGGSDQWEHSEWRRFNKKIDTTNFIWINYSFDNFGLWSKDG